MIESVGIWRRPFFASVSHEMRFVKSYLLACWSHLFFSCFQVTLFEDSKNRGCSSFNKCRKVSDLWFSKKAAIPQKCPFFSKKPTILVLWRGGRLRGSTKNWLGWDYHSFPLWWPLFLRRDHVCYSHARVIFMHDSWRKKLFKSKNWIFCSKILYFVN